MSPRESAPCPTGVQEVLARFDPDALLAQILIASPYPLEVVEATRWVKANPNLKDQALEDALQNQRLQHPLPPLSKRSSRQQQGHGGVPSTGDHAKAVTTTDVLLTNPR